MRKLTLLVGTTKGAFLISTSEDRNEWSISEPQCEGWTINHMVGDRDSGVIWAAGGGDWHGAGVWCSEDGGVNWNLSKLTKGITDDWAAQDSEFAAMIGWKDEPLPFGDKFSQVWCLAYSCGRLYAGTKPATLLASNDRGKTWKKVEELTNHPSAEGWSPGAAGLVLHTIVTHPNDQKRMWVGISAAGVFATEDGGQTWERRNRLSNFYSSENVNHPAAPSDGETGLCVHSMIRASGNEDLLFQQNHHGVWRSRDGGQNWDDINHGLPSTFGFPIQNHPRDSKTVWTFPLNGDATGRYPPNAAAAVWRTKDGGDTWQAMRNGLPQTSCYFTVLRQAMTSDEMEPVGVYFGTNSGSVFASFDEGDTWLEIARHLPTVLSVEALQPR